MAFRTLWTDTEGARATSSSAYSARQVDVGWMWLHRPSLGARRPSRIRPGHPAPGRGGARDPAPWPRPGGLEYPFLPGTRLLRPLRLPGMRPHAGLPGRSRPHPLGEAPQMTDRLLVAAVRISSLSPGKLREREDRTGSASALVLPLRRRPSAWPCRKMPAPAPRLAQGAGSSSLRDDMRPRVTALRSPVRSAGTPSTVNRPGTAPPG